MVGVVVVVVVVVNWLSCSKQSMPSKTSGAAPEKRRNAGRTSYRREKKESFLLRTLDDSSVQRPSTSVSCGFDRGFLVSLLPYLYSLVLAVYGTCACV